MTWRTATYGKDELLFTADYTQHDEGVVGGLAEAASFSVSFSLETVQITI
jgi:hypothetical protein